MYTPKELINYLSFFLFFFFLRREEERRRKAQKKKKEEKKKGEDLALFACKRIKPNIVPVPVQIYRD